jgi:hypothetical protein
MFMFRRPGHVENPNFQIFNNPVIDQTVKVQNVPRVWRFAEGESGGGFAAVGGLRPPPNARFSHGIVKIQQGFAPELLLIGSGGKTKLPNFSHSRDRSRSESTERSARLAIRRRRIRRRLRRRGRASPAAKRAFCHGIVKNQAPAAAELLLIGSGGKPELLNFNTPVIDQEVENTNF